MRPIDGWMSEIFFQTLPFFGVIALGFVAARTGFFRPAATEALTKYVFYFALSAMIFEFTSALEFSDFAQPEFISAYLVASAATYAIAVLVGRFRGERLAGAAMEGHAAVVGNVGFMGIPMLAILLGPASVAWVILILAIDLVIFGSLLVILVSISQSGRVGPRTVFAIGRGLVTNPMIVSIVLGLAWSASSLTMPDPAKNFLSLLGAGATPGALFAIGASLAAAQASRLTIASWLGFLKIIVHPLFAAISVYVLFDVDPYAASVLVAAAALPVAGNVYILAVHYGVVPTRISAAILISTLCAVVTVSTVIAWVSP